MTNANNPARTPPPHSPTSALDFPFEPGRLYYFIHPRPPMTVLAFVREQAGGARILGGRTGSHHTGHGASWWDAFTEIVSLGYIPIDLARQRGLISTDWQPPTFDP